MNTITIKGKEFKVKYSNRALIMFEQILGKPYQEPKDTTERFVFFYCLVSASNKDAEIEWDDFMDSIDEHPEYFAVFAKAMADYNKKLMQYPTEEDKDGDGEKKN